MSTRFAGAVVALAASIAATGCGAAGSASPARTPATHPASDSVTAGPPVARTSRAVGIGCDRIPATGPGSIDGMASAPVATAVAHNPLLTELARAIRKAGLTGELNSATAITVFAPEDAAFTAMGRGNLTTLLADKHDLAKTLKYQVVSGRQTPADLATGKHLTTLLGTVIVPVKKRSDYRVNEAQVVCGNIQTANATIYIVSKVLVPIP